MNHQRTFFISTTVLWIAAFLSSLFLVNEWQLELFGATVMLMFIWAVVMLSKNVETGWTISKSWALKFIGAFWLLVLLSIFWSDLPYVSIMGFCFFSMMPLGFFVFVMEPDKKQLALIGKILAGIFALLSIWAMIQFFVYNDYFDGRAKHPLANPNSLAALFNLALFPALGWMLAAKSRTQSNLALLLTVLILGGLMATGSRGAFFAAIPALGFFFFYARGFLKTHWKCLLIVAVTTGVLFAATNIGQRHQATMISRVGDTVTMAKEDVTANRLDIWDGAIAMIKDHWLSGTGIGTFFLYYPEYRVPEDAAGAYLAHSDPLQYWAELGIAGIILFYAILIAIFARTIKALNLTEKSSTQRMLILAPFSAMAAVIIHTHVTFNLYNLSILVVLGFILAVWFIASGKVLQDKTRHMTMLKSTGRSISIALIATPFLLLAFMFGSYMLSEHYTNKARDHLMAGEFEEFAADAITAHGVGFRANYRPYLLSVNIPMSVLQEAGPTLTNKQKQEIYDQVEYYLSRAKFLNPRSSAALYYLGRLQELVPAEIIPEGTPAPEEYYKQAIDMDPVHLGARLALAKIYEDRGDVAAATEILEDGLEYKYKTSLAVDYYGKLIILYAIQGENDKRQMAMRKMISFKKLMDRSDAKAAKPMSEHLFGGGDVTGH